jgi:hypothetical protein
MKKGKIVNVSQDQDYRQVIKTAKKIAIIDRI